MRRPLVIANWKMNTDLADAMIITNAVKNIIGDLDVEVVLCPPSVWLYPVHEVIPQALKNLSLGAQNMWFTEFGALTGEISPLMIKKMVKYVILGHSERRKNFHETNELVNDKVISALEHGIIPVICVGEIKKQISLRGKGRPTKIEENSDITKQLKMALAGVSTEDAEKVVIAYEPVWAISTSGTGEAASGAYANEKIEILREELARIYSRSLAERVKILYGGSVDDDNIREFIYQPEIDGALVGGASLKVREFVKICKEAGGRE